MCSSTGSDDLLPHVTTLVTQACWQICGGKSLLVAPGGFDSFEEQDEWRNQLQALAVASVRRAKQKQWTLEIRVAPALFQRFQSNNNATLSVVSALGLERRVCNAHELGQLLLLELEELSRPDHHPGATPRHQDSQRPGLWIRAAPRNGMLYVTSPEQLEALRSEGWAACPHCPHWFKGLWYHIQQQHSASHRQAKDEQAQQYNPLALVLYRPAVVLLPGLSTPLTSAAAAANPSSRDVPEASILSPATPWDFSKTGDVASLQEWMANHSNRAADSNGPAASASETVAAFDPSTSLDDKGAALLHWAAGGGHLPMVQYLVESLGCDAQIRQVSRRSFGGRTPLHWAARNGHLPVVQYLLDQCHVDATAMTQDGTTALGWAAWQGQWDVLQCLYDRDPSLIHSVNRFGCNAVLWAAQGSFENPPQCRIIEWLLKHGCNLYLVNSNGHSVLHKAAQRGRYDLAMWVVQHLFGRLSTLQKDEAATAAAAAGKESSSPLSVLEKLVGPDAEGCTPSDLAGMEHHQDLAVDLAEQEQKLAVTYWDLWRRTTSSPSLPAWMKGLLAHETLSGTDQHGDYEWGPRAGLHRLREAIRGVASSNSVSDDSS